MRRRGSLPRGSTQLLSTLLSMALLTACGWRHKDAPAAAGSGAGTAAALAAPSARDRITAPIDDKRVVVLPDTAHPRAVAKNDRGRLPADQNLKRLALEIKLSPALKAERDELLKEQQDPASPNFRKWLTPEQFAARFGPTDRDIDQLTAWLQAEGFASKRVARTRMTVFFDGTVGQAEKAFHTELHNYTIRDETRFVNATPVSVPEALSGLVLHVSGLDDVRLHASVRKHKVSPQGTDYTLGGGNYAIVPQDLATIYDLNSLYTNSTAVTGAGIGIVIIGQTSLTGLTTEVPTFRTLSGLSAINLTNTLVPNEDGSSTYTSSSDDEDESILDLSWSGAAAPSANINFVYTGSADYGVIDALQYALQSVLAPVVSMSYGGCEPDNSKSYSGTEEGWVQDANTSGVTVVMSTGDTGAAGCDAKGASEAVDGEYVQVPAAIPEVTAVGGSEFNEGGSPSTYWSNSNTGDYGSALSYIPEEAWNDTQTYGLAASTGGMSTFFTKPSWQTGTGVPADGQRDVPDIAFAASPYHDGFMLCITGQCETGYQWGNSSGEFYLYGGTSVATPIFAGILALINQSVGTSGLGNINPTLYSLAAGSNGSAVFHDITTGNNIVPCEQGKPSCPSSSPFQFGYSCGTGYDQVTGLGSVDGKKLWTYWPTTTTTSVGASPSSGALGALITLTATVTTTRIGPSPTGSVTFYNNGSTNLGSQSVTATSSSGIEGATAAISVTSLPAGTDTITAVYAGDSTYGTSTSSGTNVSITGNTFSISASPATVTVGQGGTAGTSTISTTLTGGTNQTVTFSASGVPSGATASFSPTSVTTDSSSTLTLTPGTAAIGSYTVTVSGTGSMVAQATVTFDIVANDFSMSSSPSSVSISQLGSGTSTINTSIAAGVAQSVALSASGLPTGASASFNPASVNSGSSSTMTLNPGTAATGTYTLTVTGTGTSNTHTTTVSLTVTASDFSISASPTSVSIQQNNSGTSTVSTAISSGSAETVTLSASGLPFNSTASFSPASVTAGSSSTLTLNPNTAAPGPYTITITGTGQLTTHTTPVTMTITAIPSDFSLSASPSSLSIVPGASGASTITSTLTSGAIQAITWSVSGVPTGASASFSPTSSNSGRSTLLTVDSGSATASSYTLTITGTGTSAAHTTTVGVNQPSTGQGAIKNGGFETATLTGWTTTKGSASVVGTPHTGNDSAQVGLSTPTTDSAIAQTFTPATNATTLSFWYQVVCPGVVASDWATASVTDNVTGATTTMLAHTCTSNGTWVQASTTITGGHSQTITLANHDNDQAGASTYALYDDVTVQ